MVAPPNLADPDVEPTDEDLIGLASRAFGGLRAAHEDSLRKTRAEIAAARERVLELLDERDRRRAGA